ncbi:MAG TPA: hypothetical protein VJT09_02235 [Pyrinomonadaceae bacterium]|nr:hypothetical protein [Pyrinomonadaceae bacterium]
MPSGRTLDEAGGNHQGPFPRFAASFHKLLKHDPDTGLLTDEGVADYIKLLQGLKIDAPSSDFDHEALNDINLFVSPGTQRRRVLINPRSSKALTIKGADSASYRSWELAGYATKELLLKDLSLRSATTAAEMIELYVMALLRDHRFTNYTSANYYVNLALRALNHFGDDFKGPKEGGSVTVKTLFRGNSPGDLKGDYLSKFLLLRRGPLFPSGCAPHVANLTNAQIFFNDFARYLTVPPPNPNREFGLTWNRYVEIQNGAQQNGLLTDPYRVGDFFTPAVRIANGRHLGSLVHVDSLYEEYTWAVDVLTVGDYKRTPVSIYSDPPTPGAVHARNEGDGPTLGPPDAASLVGAVALEAAREAWTQKWLVARRARPEVLAALIHKRRTGGNEATYGPLDSRLLETTGVINEVMERVRMANRNRGQSSAAATYLLGQMFPEAAPSHPAWPSGHATIGGACVTVIKAIFDDRQPVVHQTPGAEPFLDEDGNQLRVGRELDKLASNVAFGRNFGGVHYRSDGEHGILLGEKVAIRFLQDHLRTYREKFRCPGTEPCFELTKRNGRRYRITPTAEVDITPAVAAQAVEQEMMVDPTADRSVM